MEGQREEGQDAAGVELGLGRRRRRLGTTAAIVLAGFLAVGVVVGLGLYADFGKLGGELGDFQWELFPAALALVTAGYGLRFLRWQRYLVTLGIAVPARRSLVIFLAGFSMTLSPGKVGEVLKSVMLRRAYGTPVARSAPIVLAERVTDVLGTVAVAGIAAVWAGAESHWPLVVAGLGVGLGVVAALRLPLPRRFERVRAARDAALALHTPGLLAAMTVVSTASWACEAAAAYLIVRGLGLDVTAASAAVAYAIGNLAGSLSFLPGGLGVAETSMTGLLRALSGAPAAGAAAATVLIRLATLWYAVAIGVAALAVEERIARRHAPRAGD
jgi:uncharacterized membrane protein YbhN (UPF0104 family)